MLSATLCSDVLAIRCVNKYVCIGVGNCVNVYLIEGGCLVDKLKVFENDNIHGIVRGDANDLYIYGGKNLSICELAIADRRVVLTSRSVQRFDDWIIALGWTREGNRTFLCVLFAHNNLCFYDTRNGDSRTFWCQERCILYGGSVLAKHGGECVVFSGTVFQEILIWQVKHNLEYAKDIAILHRLRGHKGVIFSVTYDSALKMISSTSDDRTVRLWKVEDKVVHDANGVNWENCNVSLTTTMYGHTARVWRSIVRKKKIISVGEDSLMCLWSLDGRLLDKMEIHNGAEVWSIDVSEDDKKIFTGGADGAVNVWPFESVNILEGCPVYASDEKKVPKFVFYTQCRKVLIFMDGGHLISYDQNSKDIDASLNLPRYSSYCVMHISPDRTKVGLGSKDGHLEIFEVNPDAPGEKLKKILEARVTESKIFSFHWLSNETIIVCGDAGQLNIINRIRGIVRVRSTFVLPMSRERWTTAAIVHENLLICGDRAGSVYVYYLSEGDSGSPSPVQTFPKIHGRLGVQSFAISANKLISTGRDGTVRFYELRDSKKEMRALHLNKMPMDWVCRILATDNDLYVLGFKEVEFMVYSMKLKRIVRRFICGGGHRSWDCEIRDGKMDFLYIRDKRVYELGAELQNIDPPIISGFHTKEIYCVEPVETSSKHNIFVSASEDCTLRLSCIVENPKSTLQKYRMKTLHSYDGHISNVKSLTILNTKNDEESTRNLVISGGGRAQLKIWEMSVAVDQETLTADDVACTELLSYMLRGSDKDRKKNSQLVKPAFLVDPETRFMDIKARYHVKHSNMVVILIACSDGYLRILLYDITKNVLQLDDIVHYCSRCTLKVNMFVRDTDTIMMSMATDGIAKFWRINESIESLVRQSNDEETRCDAKEKTSVPFANIKIHQSGINSFDFRKIDDSRWLMLTGGDDNLLSLVVVEISSEMYKTDARILTSWSSSSIHYAQITGAKFVGENRMLSAGIDQRVVVHSYAYVDGLLSVSQMEETTTLVPDVQGVALFRPIAKQDEMLACVHGKGLEVIVLNHDT